MKKRLFALLALIMLVAAPAMAGFIFYDTDSDGVIDSYSLGENTAATFTSATTADAQDMTVSLTGATDSSLVVSSTGTGADALQITASAGGIDVSSQNDIDIVTTGAAGEDISITNTGGSVKITATEAAADAIVISASTAAGGIDITSQADLDITTTGAAGEDISITNTGGSVLVTATEDVAGAIYLHANGGTSETIHLHADQGTSASSINIVSDAGGITMNAGSGGVVFTAGQTRKVKFLPKDIELDGTAPAALTDTGTDGQTNISVIAFDADGGSSGDDIAFFSWLVPDGYVADSARLNVAYTFSTAEDAADEAQFDFTVNAVGAGEALDAAGTALADQSTVVGDASADNGKLHITQYNIEVEDIAVDDLVTIMVAVDESASALANSGTLDVLYFEIEYESTE